MGLHQAVLLLACTAAIATEIPITTSFEPSIDAKTTISPAEATTAFKADTTESTNISEGTSTDGPTTEISNIGFSTTEDSNTGYPEISTSPPETTTPGAIETTDTTSSVSSEESTTPPNTNTTETTITTGGTLTDQSTTTIPDVRFNITPEDNMTDSLKVSTIPPETTEPQITTNKSVSEVPIVTTPCAIEASDGMSPKSSEEPTTPMKINTTESASITEETSIDKSTTNIPNIRFSTIETNTTDSLVDSTTVSPDMGTTLGDLMSTRNPETPALDTISTVTSNVPTTVIPNTTPEYDQRDCPPGKRRPYPGNCHIFQECNKHGFWEFRTCFWFRRFDINILGCKFWHAVCLNDL